MIIAVELERCMTGACILGIVICELGYRQELSPIVLFQIDEYINISFQCAILSLGLAVCLRIKYSGQVLLIAKKVV